MAAYGALIRTGAGWPRIMPLAGPGRAGMLQDQRSDQAARGAPARNTGGGEVEQRKPGTDGRGTAAGWVGVTEGPALGAQADGAGVF